MALFLFFPIASPVSIYPVRHLRLPTCQSQEKNYRWSEMGARWGWNCLPQRGGVRQQTVTQKKREELINLSQILCQFSSKNTPSPHIGSSLVSWSYVNTSPSIFCSSTLFSFHPPHPHLPPLPQLLLSWLPLLHLLQTTWQSLAFPLVVLLPPG